LEKVIGHASFVARARLMLLLGEQLITDEVAAVAELIKNSYDADATAVEIELKNVSYKDSGQIRIIDNGNGMTRETVLNTWLELGTISKARKRDEPVRFSDVLKRPYLGEKGLGRLSIHKIGKQTELVTRKRDGSSETKLILNWSLFEDVKKYLNDIEVNWEEDKPSVFKKDVLPGYEHGTQITITKLHTQWTQDMIKKLKQFVVTIQSPFAGLADFKIDVKVDDPEDIELKTKDVEEIFDTANYVYVADVNDAGFAEIKYLHRSKIYPTTNRESIIKKHDIKPPDEFPEGKKPVCGPFKFHIYCWDLDPADKKVLIDMDVPYDTVIKPITGVKLFRDGFRVFPYGNEDNDWLFMDQSRVERFQENVSRNQVVGYVEISSHDNPLLIDKSDREGLIDNYAFKEFKSLVLWTLQNFQVERNKERLEIKKIKREDVRLAKLTTQMTELTTLLDKESLRHDTKLKIINSVDALNQTFTKILEDTEEPLLAAASIGLTYMIPTHEVQRNINESTKILKKSLEPHERNLISKIKLVIPQLVQSEEILKGLVKISQKIQDEEQFDLKKPTELAINLMRPKLARNNIGVSTDFRDSRIITGSERLITILLLNLIDNSIYWLGSKKNTDRKMKFTIGDFNKKLALIVSDNGPGIQDDIEVITLPFVTRKPKGMGLGLYICKRIADMHGAKLKLLSEFERPGLLSGANIAILFSSDKN